MFPDQPINEDTNVISIHQSPPFVRAPAEDRSKYEKLTYDVADSSSDESDEVTAIKEKPGKLCVLQFRLWFYWVLALTHLHTTFMLFLDDQKKLEHSNLHPSGNGRRQGFALQQGRHNKVEVPNSSAYLSDDSIGSASDLHINVNDEEREEFESEGESDERTVGKQGSSSRHSHRRSFNELESLNTCGSSAYHAECDSETTHDENRSPTSQSRRRKDNKNNLSSLPNSEGESDLLFVGHQYGEKPLLADDELDSSEGGYSSGGTSPHLKSTIPAKCWNEQGSVDVFALAPFPALVPKDPTLVGRPLEYVVEGSLVDLEDPLENAVLLTDKKLNQVVRESTPIRGVSTEDTIKKSEDLFGSSPFHESPTENPFTQVGSRTRPNCVPSSSSQKQLSEHSSQIPRTIDVSGRKLPELRSLDSELRGITTQGVSSFYSQFSPFSTSYSGAKTNDEEDQSKKSDLFGAPPFTCETKMPSQSSCPSSLNLSQTCNDVSQSWHSHPMSQKKFQTMSVLQSHGEVDPGTGTVPKKDWYDKETRDGKYHLIDEARSVGKPNILPVKNSHKVKGAVSSLSKKSKSSKKSSEKAGGFQNMSFEDFSSDDPAEPSPDLNKFEVVRNEAPHVAAIERKGSLKRRSNPFS